MEDLRAEDDPLLRRPRVRDRAERAASRAAGGALALRRLRRGRRVLVREPVALRLLPGADLWERVDRRCSRCSSRSSRSTSSRTSSRWEAGARSTPLARFAAILGVPMLASRSRPYHEPPARPRRRLLLRLRPPRRRAHRARAARAERARRAPCAIASASSSAVGALAMTFTLARLPLVPRRAPAADRRRARDRLPLRPRRVAHAPAPRRPLRARRAPPRLDRARVRARRRSSTCSSRSSAASTRCT